MAKHDPAPGGSTPPRTGRRASGRTGRPAAPDTPLAEKVINARIDGDVAERAMNAFYGTHLHPRWRDYIQAALEEYTARLEHEHNRGQPFPPRPREQLTRGRKVGISPRRTGP